jgi:hypothetical protein
MNVLNPDLLWEEEKEPLVPLAAKDTERIQARGNALDARADPLATRMQRTAGNGALTREAEAAGLSPHAPRSPGAEPASAAPPAQTARRNPGTATGMARPPAGPVVQDRDLGTAPRQHQATDTKPVNPSEAGRKQAPAAAGHQEEATLEAAARKPPPSGTTPETMEEARAVALAAALDRALADFATNPEATDLLGLARLAEGASGAVAMAAADALARAVTRADVEHRAAIARRLALDLKPHPDLQLVRLLAGLMAGVMAPPPAPALAPPPPPP